MGNKLLPTLSKETKQKHGPINLPRAPAKRAPMQELATAAAAV